MAHSFDVLGRGSESEQLISVKAKRGEGTLECEVHIYSVER